jgi:hypothetical protein
MFSQPARCLALLFAFALAACGSSSPATFTITLDKPGTGTGNVIVYPSGPDYTAGTSVTLTADAASGSTFVGWGGACQSTETLAACTLTVSANKTVTATFQPSTSYVSSTFTAAMSSVTFHNNCSYALTATGVLTMALVPQTGGYYSQMSSTVHFAVTNTNTPSGTTCSLQSFDMPALGGRTNATGISAELFHLASNGSPVLLMDYQGALSANTITGSMNVSLTLFGSDGEEEDPTGTTGTFSAVSQ